MSTMPSQSRTTKRRNFSISLDASIAIDEYAEEYNITKSKVVENAVLEYTGKDATARIEQKVDEILATLEGDGPSPAQTREKEKKNQKTQSDFDPTSYNPDEDRDNPLTKAELKELVALDEPVINPDHVNWDSLFRDVRKKATLLAGVCRFNANGIVTNAGITNAIKENLGESDHLLDQYTETVPDEFEEKPCLEFNNDEERYENNSWAYFPTESHRREYYQDRYESIQEAVSTPVDEMPKGDSLKQRYEFLRQWLDEWQINTSLTELDIATDEERAELKEELVAYRSDVDQCLSAIEETTDKYSKDFSREEAIEAVPYDEEQSESMIALLEELSYIANWDRPGKDMGMDKRHLVWRD